MRSAALRPTVEPRATEHIDEMRQIIEKLIANGNAYVAAGPRAVRLSVR